MDHWVVEAGSRYASIQDITPRRLGGSGHEETFRVREHPDLSLPFGINCCLNQVDAGWMFERTRAAYGSDSSVADKDLVIGPHVGCGTERRELDR